MSAIDIQDHIVSNASYMPSPNHDLRPEEADISLIVIHCISLPPGAVSYTHLTLPTKA